MGKLTSSLFSGAPPIVLQELQNCADGTPNEVISHFGPCLRQNSREAILLLQRALKLIGSVHPEMTLPVFSESGTYDPPFANAVAEYKRTHGLLNYAKSIDSLIGKKTIKAMDDDLSHFVPVPPPAPAPQPPPNIDPTPAETDGEMRLLTSGMWNKATTLSITGGQTVLFKLRNVNAIGCVISIKAVSNSQSRTLFPLGTTEVEFQSFGRNPSPWSFKIDSESDAFCVFWEVWTSWLPGDLSTH